MRLVSTEGEKPFPVSEAGRVLPSRPINRAQFLDRVARELLRTKQSLADRYVILYVDIDRFKVVSGSLGRQTGDHLLSAIGSRIGAPLSRQDAFASMGGDEFAILIEERPAIGSATEFADAIQRSLTGGFLVDGTTIYATASIGIARVGSGYTRPEDILRDAEIAMYHAKTRGRARAEVFRPTMRTQAKDLFDLETDLRRAVEREEFELHYQPVVSMNTGKVRAFEALLRWRHPVRGLQCPGTFLPLLKETGLILAVGRWVIQEACVQAKKWDELRGRPVPVTINLAPQQFTHTSVVDVVAEAIESSGVHPGALILEITEDALIEDLAAARATLLPLRDWGVRTMIDDFGTGYSSLSYLRQLPIDGIKIDASFVDRIERYSEDRLIVRAVVALAHALDLCVVAEGIERPEQLRELRNLECEEGQGYMISLPVDAATATAMVAGKWVANV